MSFILDTNVLSDVQRKRPNAGVAEWLATTPPQHMFVSVLTVGEVCRGATKLRERGDHSRASAIEGWIAKVVRTFGDRVLPITTEVAQAWAEQHVRRRDTAVDELVAATATVHRLTVVTRNTKDFEHTRVRVLNPFSE